MARRSGVQDFLNNFNAAFNATRQVGQAYEIANVANAKPVQSEELTAEDSAKVQAAAADSSKQIGYDEGAKAYMATPKLAEDEMGPAQPVEVARARPMTEFLGKRIEGSMTPEQVSGAKFKAMADVVSKYDPLQGMRLQREVKQGERDDKRWEREDTAATKAEADKAFAEKLDGQVGEWFKGRLKNPDGTERAPTVDDHLAASQYRAAQLTGAGKIDQAGQVLKDYAAQSLVKIQLQGAQRKEALGRTASALAAGNLDAAKDFYNEFVPDGARVTDVKRGAGGELVIQRESLDGRTLPPYTMKDTGQLLSALNSFNDPMALYSWSQNEFKNNLDARKTAVAERQADIAERRLGALEARANGGGGGGGGGRGGGGRGEADAPSFNPLGNFDSKKAQAVAFEQAAAAVDDKGRPLSPQEQGKRAQQIYRSMEDAFATENRNRHVAATVGAELRAARSDPAAYAKSYSEALQVMDAKTLEGMGFKAPDGARQGAAPAPSARQGAEGSPATPKVLATMGGGVSKKAEPYTPPADSPAGKAQASREAARTASMEQEARRIKAVTDAASAAIASGDPAAAQAVQSMPGFGTLPLEQKAQIRRIVFGR